MEKEAKSIDQVPCTSCNILVPTPKSFDIYNKKFCSMKCLLTWKLKNIKPAEKPNDTTFRKPDSGGSRAY